jgi:hypothetical protein
VLRFCIATKLTWGQCYDHYFRRLSPIFGDFRLFLATFAYFRRLLPIFGHFCLFSATFAYFRRLLPIFGDFCLFSAKKWAFFLKTWCLFFTNFLAKIFKNHNISSWQWRPVHLACLLCFFGWINLLKCLWKVIGLRNSRQRGIRSSRKYRFSWPEPNRSHISQIKITCLPSLQRVLLYIPTYYFLSPIQANSIHQAWPKPCWAVEPVTIWIISARFRRPGWPDWTIFCLLCDCMYTLGSFF